MTEPTADYYEFTIEPWISEVEFQQVILKHTNGTLSGPHPLLEKKDYFYVKENN